LPQREAGSGRGPGDDRQLRKIGKQPVPIGLGYKYDAEKPASTLDRGIRFVFTLLLPSQVSVDIEEVP
jgi:hypothetical protein